jgi:hypothetical protein
VAGADLALFCSLTPEITPTRKIDAEVGKVCNSRVSNLLRRKLPGPDVFWLGVIFAFLDASDQARVHRFQAVGRSRSCATDEDVMSFVKFVGINCLTER